MIRGLLVAHRVGGLESLEELRKHLLLGLFTGHNIRVLVGGVDTADIVDIDHARAIGIHLGESAHCDSLATGRHRSTNGAKELVVLDQTRTVEIEVSEKRLDFTLGEAEHVVRHGLAEFKFIEGHGVVIVHDAELLGEADDATGTTGLQLVAKALEEVFTSSLATGGSATDLSLEDLAGEFTVVEASRLILVVEVEEGIQILDSYEIKLIRISNSYSDDHF